MFSSLHLPPQASVSPFVLDTAFPRSGVTLHAIEYLHAGLSKSGNLNSSLNVTAVPNALCLS